MMAPTHVAAGLSVAAAVTLVAPEFGAVAAVAAVAGSVFPDLDMVFGEHRRTLHPVEAYGLLAALAVGTAVVTPSPPTVAVATFLVAATLHPIFDLAGGSSEPRPWEAATDRGVYLRSRGGWVAPRRWVRYDGAPEDFGLAVLLAAPGVAVYGRPVTGAAVAVLGVGLGYTLWRKRLPQLSGYLNLPVPPVLTAVVALVSFFRSR
jgi:hypothetical protein